VDIDFRIVPNARVFSSLLPLRPPLPVLFPFSFSIKPSPPSSFPFSTVSMCASSYVAIPGHFACPFSPPLSFPYVIQSIPLLPSWRCHFRFHPIVFQSRQPPPPTGFAAVPILFLPPPFHTALHAGAYSFCHFFSFLLMSSPSAAPPPTLPGLEDDSFPPPPLSHLTTTPDRRIISVLGLFPKYFPSPLIAAFPYDHPPKNKTKPQQPSPPKKKKRTPPPPPKPQTCLSLPQLERIRCSGGCVSGFFFYFPRAMRR